MKRLILLLALVLALGPPALAQKTVYVSPDVPTDDPGGSGTIFLPWDVIEYQAGVYTPVPVLTLPTYTALLELRDDLAERGVAGRWSD